MQHPQLPVRDKSGYLAKDTIAAIATAVGGALAVVRVSGPNAFDLLYKVSGGDRSAAEPRKLYRVTLRASEDDLIDDALFVRFVGPESYTGEDTVEFHIHGGAFVANRLMETLVSLGARQALPGEFSFRAVRNGKLTLSQATAVADLIAATNPGAVHLALEKLSGTQNRLISEIARNLKALAVLGEVGIDFSDQDVDEVSLPTLKKRLGQLIQTLKNLHSSYDRGIRLQEGLSVAFVGLPNAGKSSFFNALLGEDRSIVSNIPGTTRDVVREKITLRGKNATITLRLEDTAGLRIADNEIERIGIHRTHKTAREADIVLLLIDPTAPLEPARVQWQGLQCPADKTIGVLTKSDLATPTDLATVLDEIRHLGICSWVTTSVMTGTGINEAVQSITDFCSSLVQREKGEVLLTRIDQLDAVSEALSHLERAQGAPEIDLFASDIRQALHALAPLIGETAADDILGQIFSEFCIGK